MKKIKICLIFLLAAAILAGCKNIATDIPSVPSAESSTESQSAASSNLDATSAELDSNPEETSEESVTESSEEIVLEEDAFPAWEFNDGYPLYIGPGLTGEQTFPDMDFPPCSYEFNYVDNRFREEGITLLYHMCVQPIGSKQLSEQHDYPFHITESDAVEACHAYMESLDIPFERIATDTPLFDESATDTFHATLSYADMKKLYEEAHEAGYELRFFSCNCGAETDYENTLDIPCP